MFGLKEGIRIMGTGSKGCRRQKGRSYLIVCTLLLCLFWSATRESMAQETSGKEKEGERVERTVTEGEDLDANKPDPAIPDDSTEAAKIPAEKTPALESKARERDPRKRWEQFSERKKKEIRKKYDYFKSLSKEERGELRTRHRKLKMLEQSLSEQEDPGPDGPPPPPRDRGDLYERIRDFLNERQTEVTRRFPKLRGGDDKDRRHRARRMRRQLEDRNSEEMHSFLDRLVKEGVITPEEAEKILDLPPDEKMDKLFRLGKDLRLMDMEGWLSPEEEKEWRRMEPWDFHRRMHRERERGRFHLPEEGLGRLTPEQKEILDRMPFSPERRERLQRFIDENVRSRLEQAGVESKQINRLMSLPPHKRFDEIRKKLKSLEEQGKTIPPEIKGMIEEYGEPRSFQGKERDDRDDRRQRRGRQRREGKRFF